MKRLLLVMFLSAVALKGLDAFAQVPFQDDFKGGKLDLTKWTIATYRSPDSKPGLNEGRYVASAIEFDQGMLCIIVRQSRTAGAAVESLGGAIISRERFGFGTYEFEMRMSSAANSAEDRAETLSGGISSAFLYYNKSESEIDLEFLGNENAIWISSWQNPTPSQAPTPRDKRSDKVDDRNLATRLRRYTLIWKPKSVDVYIDGKLVAHQTEHIPQSPAHIILQHRGTNSSKWGGAATPGITRRFFVRSVKFTPLDKN